MRMLIFVLLLILFAEFVFQIISLVRLIRNHNKSCRDENDDNGFFTQTTKRK